MTSLSQESLREIVQAHELKTLHADGAYVHILGHGSIGTVSQFELTTWPGHLHVQTPHGSFSFRAPKDPLEFFLDENMPKSMSNLMRRCSTQTTLLPNGIEGVCGDKLQAYLRKQYEKFVAQHGSLIDEESKEDLLEDLMALVHKDFEAEDAVLPRLQNWSYEFEYQNARGFHSLNMTLDVYSAQEFMEHSLAFRWCYEALGHVAQKLPQLLGR